MPGGGGTGEEAAVAGRAAGRIEDGDLALELEDAAVDERPPGEDGVVVVEVACRKIIGTVDDHAVAGEKREGVGGGDASGVYGDVEMRFGCAEAGGGGEFLLPFHADAGQEEVPAIAGKFGGREGGGWVT